MALCLINIEPPKASAFYDCILCIFAIIHYFYTEANYAYKLKRPIIPLLMEENYDPDGWLGIILGTKLYYLLWQLFIKPSSIVNTGPAR